MVSTRNLVIIIVGGAIVAGVGFLKIGGLMEDSPQGQLQRSRLGLDKEPSLYDLYKDTPQVKKLEQEARESWKNLRYPDAVRDNKTGLYVLPKINNTNTNTTSLSKAGYAYNDLSAEEEQYEPWALR